MCEKKAVTINQVLQESLQASMEGTERFASKPVKEVLRAAARAAEGTSVYADACWVVQDILDNYHCTPEQAEGWLAQEESRLRDHMVEAGWLYIDTICTLPKKNETSRWTMKSSEVRKQLYYSRWAAKVIRDPKSPTSEGLGFSGLEHCRRSTTRVSAIDPMQEGRS